MRVTKRISEVRFEVNRPNPTIHAVGAPIVRAHEHGVLDAAVSASLTTWRLRSGALVHEGNRPVRLQCGGERVRCIAQSGNELTLNRAPGTAAAHAAGTMVYRLDGDATLSTNLSAATTDATLVLDDADFLPRIIAPTSRILLICNREVMRCTARTGNILTVVRGAEGTTCEAHMEGAVVTQVAGYAELFTSEFSAGLLLDLHINAPAFVTGFTDKAIGRTSGNPHDENGDLAPHWLERFGTNFFVVRQPKADWSNGPERNEKLLPLHDRRASAAGDADFGLSSAIGSFSGWERSRR